MYTGWWIEYQLYSLWKYYEWQIPPYYLPSPVPQMTPIFGRSFIFSFKYFALSEIWSKLILSLFEGDSAFPKFSLGSTTLHKTKSILHSNFHRTSNYIYMYIYVWHSSLANLSIFWQEQSSAIADPFSDMVVIWSIPRLNLQVETPKLFGISVK